MLPATTCPHDGGARHSQRACWLRQGTQVWALLWALLLSTPFLHAANSDYVLNAGDEIRILVFGEDDLSFGNITISTNGAITYPFLGELIVSGKSAAELQREITSALKPDYLVDPRVSVSVVTYRPFFINGEVRRSGGLQFQPGLTLRKAISLAGGFTERANKREIEVISDDEPDTERKVGLDYRVKPGDIITVKDTFF